MAAQPQILNINNQDDPFYRYKMPALQIKQQTNCVIIENLAQVSTSLKRNQKMILKFFGIRLGTQVSDSKSSINGTFKAHELQEALQEFIQTYVLCPDCGNPETEFYLKKKTYKRTCKACGIDVACADCKLLKYAIE